MRCKHRFHCTLAARQVERKSRRRQPAEMLVGADVGLLHHIFGVGMSGAIGCSSSSASIARTAALDDAIESRADPR